MKLIKVLIKGLFIITIVEIYVLNFFGANSHIELLLTYGDNMCYFINRWAQTNDCFFKIDNINRYINQANSNFHFTIIANPNEIASAWVEQQNATNNSTNILTENCADAVERFLEKFANIPKAKKSSNISFNHMILGIFCPSFLPFITLPGRVFSNAKFHIKARNKPMLGLGKIILFYTALIFSVALSLTALLIIPIAIEHHLVPKFFVFAIIFLIFILALKLFRKAHNMLLTDAITKDVPDHNVGLSTGAKIFYYFVIIKSILMFMASSAALYIFYRYIDISKALTVIVVLFSLCFSLLILRLLVNVLFTKSKKVKPCAVIPMERIEASLLDLKEPVPPHNNYIP